MRHLLFLFLAAANLTSAFILPQHSSSSLTLGRKGYGALNLAKKHSEYSVIEEDDDVDVEKSSGSDYTVVNADKELSPDRTLKRQRFEYAAFSPFTATTLQIQVGDLALARKAWKKRRRSGSPLLVPCSVINMDRVSMLRENMIYLLYKFGTPNKSGMVLSMEDLNRRFRSHLKGDLSDHATALGYDSTQDLVEGLFKGKAVQENYGVELIHPDDKGIYLRSPLSKFRANKKAAQATLLQVVAEDDENALDTMKHTGHVRIIRMDDNERRAYAFPPLSAALRVSQKEDVNTGNIQEGSRHAAVFFEFDDQGDGGHPLLTLSLNPARRPGAKSSSNSAKTTRTHQVPIRKPKHMLADLQVGAGPYEAKVVRLAKDHALVDFGVGRKLLEQSTDDDSAEIGTPEFVKVFATLRFKDAIDLSSKADDNDGNRNAFASRKKSAKDEVDVFSSMEKMLDKVDTMDDLEDGEEAEDITHLFSLNEDGSLSYNNPETGETEVVDSTGDDEEEVEEDEEEDQPVTFDVSSHLKRLRKPRTIRLRVGDSVSVHISSVSKQSCQIGVTTDPSKVRGKKAKDVKKDNVVNKKLERLSKMLGGLDKAEALRGREYDGTVKATSRTGDWLYVQPNPESGGDNELSLPVGVATIPEELAAEYESSSFAQGDLVRIQLDGIDESRGQLAMRVIQKLSP